MTATIINFPSHLAHRRSAVAAADDERSFGVGDRVFDTFSCCNGVVTAVEGALYAVQLEGGTGVSRCIAELLPPKPTTPAA